MVLWYGILVLYYRVMQNYPNKLYWLYLANIKIYEYLNQTVIKHINPIYYTRNVIIQNSSV